MRTRDLSPYSKKFQTCTQRLVSSLARLTYSTRTYYSGTLNASLRRLLHQKIHKRRVPQHTVGQQISPRLIGGSNDVQAGSISTHDPTK
jgi:hypothetical protein